MVHIVHGIVQTWVESVKILNGKYFNSQDKYYLFKRHGDYVNPPVYSVLNVVKFQVCPLILI